MEKSEYLNIGPSGTFKASGNKDHDSIPTDVDNLFGNAGQTDPLKPEQTDPHSPFQIDPRLPIQIDPLKTE